MVILGELNLIEVVDGDVGHVKLEDGGVSSLLV